jgi:RNA polymerase sigma-70 factor (ECF subfamily)
MEKEFWHQFHGLTRKMSRLEREVFILRYLDELGIREIADTLKRNESTVKTHLYRALRKFKRAHGFRALFEGNEL